MTTICQHCGRDNAGYESEPCAEDCPQYDVIIRVDDENYAEAFWVAFNSDYPAIAAMVRNGEAVVDQATWQAIQQLDGFSNGPAYAPNALVVVE
jgi:hypothetical protein